MKALAFILLPWPPGVNHYWRSVMMGKSARVIISARGRIYRQSVAASIMTQFPIPFKTIFGPVSVAIECVRPDRRRRDLDNLLKAPLDALVHANVLDDDSQIRDLRIFESQDANGSARIEAPGKLLVMIKSI